MSTAISGLGELLQISREYALLGNYSTSLTYYDGFNAQLSSYLVRLELLGKRRIFFSKKKTSSYKANASI